MAGQAVQVQEVVEYFKTHPEDVKRAKDSMMTHPGDFKAALKDIAAERNWDLTNIDNNALKMELGKLI